MTASVWVRPWVSWRLRVMASGWTSRPSAIVRACLSAPLARQKISGSAIYSISQGPVERSWPVAIASSSAAACWRTMAAHAWM